MWRLSLFLKPTKIRPNPVEGRHDVPRPVTKTPKKRSFRPTWLIRVGDDPIATEVAPEPIPSWNAGVSSNSQQRRLSLRLSGWMIGRSPDRSVIVIILPMSGTVALAAHSQAPRIRFAGGFASFRCLEKRPENVYLDLGRLHGFQDGSSAWVVRLSANAPFRNPPR